MYLTYLAAQQWLNRSPVKNYSGILGLQSKKCVVTRSFVYPTNNRKDWHENIIKLLLFFLFFQKIKKDQKRQSRKTNQSSKNKAQAEGDKKV